MAANNWTIKHLDHDDDEITTLVPENVQFSLQKGENGPHTIQYEVSRGRGVTAPDFVGAKRTKFELYTDDDVVLSGFHSPLDVENDTEMASIGGKGWLWYLDNRYWPYESSSPNAHRVGYPSTDSDNPPVGFAYYRADEAGFEVADVITAMLDEVLDMPNSLDITYSLADFDDSLTYYTVDLIDTETILSKITALAQRDPGEFDFEIDNSRVFRIHAARRYSMDVVDDPDHADIEHIFDTEDPSSGLLSVKFTNTGPDCTRLIGSGDSQGLNIVSTHEYIPASEAFYLWENTVDFPDFNDKDMINRLTRKQLLFGVNPVHEITIGVVTDVITNFWTRFKPGIAIWLRCDLEAHNIDSAQEIVSIDCVIDQGGDAIVTMKLNQIYAASAIS